MTPDPAAELTRLTPHPGTLDRDALLFHAGRASARPGRGWKAAVVALALGHAGWLATLFRTDSTAPVSPVLGTPGPPPTPRPAPQPEPESPAPAPLAAADDDPADLAAHLWPRTPPAAPDPGGAPHPPTRPLTAGADVRFFPMN